MCFSANASFAASAVVGVAGIVSIRKIETKTQIMLACIPVVFCVQQITEGFVWLTFTHKEYHHWQSIPVMMFLFIAQVVWPLWVPLAMLLVEKDRARKIGLKILVGISVVLAPLQAYRLFFFPFGAEVTPNHIHYSLDFSIPYFGLVLNVFYFLTTIVPPFLSKSKRLITLGFLNLTSFIFTVILFEKNVISVWCFFAALISLQVVLAMKELNSKPGLGTLAPN